MTFGVDSEITATVVQWGTYTLAHEWSGQEAPKQFSSCRTPAEKQATRSVSFAQRLVRAASRRDRDRDRGSYANTLCVGISPSRSSPYRNSSGSQRSTSRLGHPGAVKSIAGSSKHNK